MKIDPQQLQAVFLRPETADKSDKAAAYGNPAEDFAAILEAQTANAAATSPELNLSLQESSASLLTSSLLGLLQAGKSDSATSPAALGTVPAVDSEIESVLDILENYMNALGDPQKTLKEIAPLADDLDRGATKLDQLASSLEEGDPLKSLTNDTAALAAVEALKFRRGDLI